MLNFRTLFTSWSDTLCRPTIEFRLNNKKNRLYNWSDKGLNIFLLKIFPDYAKSRIYGLILNKAITESYKMFETN